MSDKHEAELAELVARLRQAWNDLRFKAPVEYPNTAMEDAVAAIEHRFRDAR